MNFLTNQIFVQVLLKLNPIYLIASSLGQLKISILKTLEINKIQKRQITN